MRHAAVSYFPADGQPVDPDDVPLTTEGEEQARLAAEVLADVHFDRVITSGLRRTLETARIVAPDQEPESQPALVEIRGGRLEEIAEDGLEAAFTGVFAGAVPSDTEFLGGETIGSLMDRVVPALEELTADPAWNTILAVLHGGVNRAILSHAISGGRRFFGGFEQTPACINILDVGERGWVVRVVNQAAHLPLTDHARSTTMEEYYAELVALREAGLGDRGRRTRER